MKRKPKPESKGRRHGARIRIRWVLKYERPYFLRSTKRGDMVVRKDENHQEVGK
jgi:hypothetical protein